MSRILVVSYNEVMGVPVGRHERGGVIVYSGDYGKAKYTGVPWLGAKQVAVAEAKVAELAHDIVDDINSVDEVYVYVGRAAMGGAMRLIVDLKKACKKVHMVACTCERADKQFFADGLGVADVIWSACSGYAALGEIVRQFANDG